MSHAEKRELYLSLLSEARDLRIPHFQVGTGEQTVDDHDRYLVWEPGPHWDRAAWKRLLGEHEVDKYRARVTDDLG